MAGTPSHIASALGGTKQLITDLSLLNDRSMPTFVKKYPDLARKNYILMREAQGDSKRADNNLIKYWTPKGKNIPSFKAVATVTGSAGADITVEVADAYYTNSGTRSPIAAGQYYQNDNTGQVYKVISVNTATAMAHTAVLRITKAAQAPSVLLTDLLTLAPTIVGEASDTQESIFQVDEQISSYMATIKTSLKFSDWSLMEKTDIPGLFKARQMDAHNDVFLDMQERLLMLTDSFDNISGVTNQHRGLVPLVQSFGQVDVASTVINAAYFENEARLIDAEGYAREYDCLMNINYRIQWENYIATLGSAGSIVYNTDGSSGPMEVARNFKSYNVHGIKQNAMTYDHFSSANRAGAAISTGVYNNACLKIPKGDGVGPDGLNIPRLSIRWNQAEGSDSPIRVRTTGGLAVPATNDKEELIVSHVAHKGVQAFGLQGYLWTKLA